MSLWVLETHGKLIISLRVKILPENIKDCKSVCLVLLLFVEAVWWSQGLVVKELWSPKAGGEHPFLWVVPSNDKFTHVMTLLVLPTLTRVLIPGIAALGSTCCVWGGEPVFHSTAFATTVYLDFFTCLCSWLPCLKEGLITCGCCWRVVVTQ